MKVIDIILERTVSSQGGMRLTIFDIDDTLFHTTAKINVIKDGKVVRSLTNQQFNNYQLQQGEQFDFGEFRSAEKFAKESQPIKPMINTLKRILNKAANTKVIMLTARADFDDKNKFLDTFEKHGIDMSRVHVHRAGNLPGDEPPAYKKAVWVRKYLNTGKYNRVNLIDDSMSNLQVFKSLKKEYPNVDFDAYFVKPEGSLVVVESWSEKYKRSINCANPKGFSQRAHCQGRKKNEDQHPNEVPQGPETKPTMPKGTVRVDVSDVYDWYKLGQRISNLKNANRDDFGKGPPSTILSFGSEEEEHQYIQDLMKLGLSTTDIDPASHKKVKGQKVDPTYNVDENFADGRNPQDKGDSTRHGIPKKASIATLKKIRSSDSSSPRKKQLAHWQINMRQGRKK